MDISNIMGDGISSMLVEYLNDESYTRLVDVFTVEGYKVGFENAFYNHIYHMYTQNKKYVKNIHDIGIIPSRCGFSKFCSNKIGFL